MQFALMAVAVATWCFPWPPPRALQAIGAVVAVAGAAVAAWAARTLGPALTPLPAPRGALVTHGPFRFARHPIYGGGILFFGGLSLVFNPLALAATSALGLWWKLKSEYEERLLEERYPGYVEYRRHVRARFLPRLY